MFKNFRVMNSGIYRLNVKMSDFGVMISGVYSCRILGLNPEY